MPLIKKDKSHLMVIDIQAQLMPSIIRGDDISAATARLVRLARTLGVGCTLSEHYPKGLGATLPELREHFADGDIFEKISFSCTGDDALGEHFARLQRDGVSQIILCGLETHICVLQTGLGLMAQGFEIFVAIDATSARSEPSHALGTDRLRQAGTQIVNSDMVVFEWLGKAGTDAFRSALPIIKSIPA